jgi:alanyl-tRNA synthetase
MPVTSETIRETFLSYFERNGHLRIDGASVRPKDDPTLLFVNSGMAPLKRYFTGDEIPPAKDLCNIQSCIRTKDIDDVGDRHHLTFFEMMGSWSIGNYFKDRAVELAFGLLTEGFGFRPEQLYVTVFEGDKALGLPPDEESARAWERVGMARDRIVPQPAADNFWGPAGSSGPCGPCTEVFLDTGDAYGPAYVPGGVFDTTRRYIEIWNAGVFMQFDKGLDGSIRPLPFTSVDTGSGLERICLALNGLDNVYQSDLLAPVVATAQQILGESGPPQTHHYVIADHMRAAVKIVSDGVLPGNEGAGYIPRRLIRKSMTVALRRGADTFEFRPLVDDIVGLLGDHHPALRARHGAVLDVLDAECREFGTAVRRGLDRVTSLLDSSATVSGADAFRLFATYGLPVEITRDIAAERGAAVSMDEYEVEYERHQRLSRGAERTDRRLRIDDVLPASLAALPATEFLGYESLEADVSVAAVFRDGALTDTVEAGAEGDLITDRSPFYAEGGGQVGDRGTFSGADGLRGEILDTVQHRSGRSLHRVRVTAGTLRSGASVRLAVDAESRRDTMANHTGTHLLNAALRQVLGDHVRQAGSLVEPRRLRFDFTHPKPVTEEELAAVESLVNEWILRDESRAVEVSSPEAAKSAGALSLDGEAYGDEVRVVSFGGVSKELCGGTHVPHTSFIGSFRITAEQSVASGVRRINAVTRGAAAEYSLEQGSSLLSVARVLRSSATDVVTAAERVAKQAAAKKVRGDGGGGRAEVARHTVGGVEAAVVTGLDETAGLRQAVQRIADGEGRVTLGVGSGDRAAVALGVPAGVGRSAATLLKTLLSGFGGNGGGNDRIAQGAVSGVDPAALSAGFLDLLGQSAAAR